MRARDTADLVLRGGRIFDGARRHPTATAVAVVDGTIAAVGSDDDVRERFPHARDVLDVRGGLVTPGFVDAHVHAAFAGYEATTCDLSGALGRSDYPGLVRAYADASDPFAPDPGGPSAHGWITGAGWSMAHFPGGNPTAAELDLVVPDRPAFLLNRDHHGAWVNSAALRLAGIHAGTPDPADGRIERGSDGSPSGALHEGAMDLVTRILPEPSIERLAAGILAAQEHLAGFGVTGWQEAIVGQYAGYPDVAAAYRHTIADGTLRARATGALWLPRDADSVPLADLVGSFVGRRAANAARGFRTDTIKLMVDGVPENRSAALEEPYLEPCGCSGVAAAAGGWCPSEDRGMSYLGPELLNSVVPALHNAGFNLHFHVIGDRAVRTALDAVALTRPAGGPAGLRHHMAHLQIVNPRDVPRFAELGVTANLQALWACNDAQMRELTLPILGTERAAWQYPFADLDESGAELAMGSDWSVSTPDPWQAIHVAVNRTPPGRTTEEPLLPRQALGLRRALEAYTAGSARVLHFDDAGRVAVGARADLAVSSVDPFGLPAGELHTVRNVATVVAGSLAAGALPG